MTIKVRERSKTDLFIRCNTETEKQYVMMIFLEMKSQPRMDDQIIVKDISGRELRLPKKEMPPPEPEQKPFVEGISDDNFMGKDEHMQALMNKKQEPIDDHVGDYSEDE